MNTQSQEVHLTEGSKVPEVTFKIRVRDDSMGGENPFRWQDVTSTDIFAGKKVVVFGLPGAFTPTCSTTHAPGYEEMYADFKDAGVDEVYCLSVNDAFVMKQWADKLGISKVQMLPDGNADFTRGMGMLVEKSNLGFGERSWRYSMFVNDGTIEKLFVEPGYSDNCADDPFQISDAKTILEYIKG
jgi:thioredoxin-dependent peroxiredoxin